MDVITFHLTNKCFVCKNHIVNLGLYMQQSQEWFWGSKKCETPMKLKGYKMRFSWQFGFPLCNPIGHICMSWMGPNIRGIQNVVHFQNFTNRNKVFSCFCSILLAIQYKRMEKKEKFRNCQPKMTIMIKMLPSFNIMFVWPNFFGQKALNGSTVGHQYHISAWGQEKCV